MTRTSTGDSLKWKVDGDRLRLCRLERKQTQRVLASTVGITQATLSNYENGKRVPTLQIGIALAAELGMPLSDLVVRSDATTPTPRERLKQVMRVLTDRPDLVETLARLCLPTQLDSNGDNLIDVGVVTRALRSRRAQAVGVGGRRGPKEPANAFATTLR